MLIKRFQLAAMCLPLVLLTACAETQSHGDQPHDDHSHHHAHGGTAEFLAHAAVMVESGPVKILFDPIFDKDYGSFQLVAQETQAKLMAGQAPFDGVDAVFVSHAHGDHFAAGMMIDYLNANSEAALIAPEQALEKLRKEASWDEALLPRIHADPIALNMSSNHTYDLGGTPVEVTRLRLPHAGGERQAVIENIVYRVSLNSDAVVMHLGDTDPDEQGLRAQSPVFKAATSDMAFVPVWFIGAANETTTHELLNAEQVVGVHVPKKVPESLAASGEDYFSKAGEIREFGK